MQTSQERSNSELINVRSLSWDEYLKLIYKLVSKIQTSEIKMQYVYGIPRGGLIPATIISHELNIPLISGVKHFEVFGVVLNSEHSRNLLIVDDICDTGETLRRLLGYNQYLFTATIFKHKRSPIEPTFYECVNDDWIKFPYERT